MWSLAVVATACSLMSLAAAPSIVWTHTPLHAPAPAWPDPGKEWNRLAFDRAHRVTVAGDLVVFASSADHQVHALSMRTGEERWRFSAEGPVRFAPATAAGRLYVPSDDGRLYCLQAATGELLWTFRGAPRDQRLVGNGRVISRWPMRSSAIVRDGVVYCTAGMWSSDGVYVYALDATTGKVIWKNDSSAQVYQKMPHDSAESISGLSPQGYLLVAGDTLIVPTGRSTPVGFDIRTGERLYMRTNFTKRHHPGSSWLTLINDLVVSERRKPRMIKVLPGRKGPANSEGLIGWHHRTGDLRFALTGKHRAATNATRLFLTGSGTIWGCNLSKFMAIADGKLRQDTTGTVADTVKIRSLAHELDMPWSRVRVPVAKLEDYRGAVIWEAPLGLTYELAVLPGMVVAGGEKEVTAFAANTGRELWRVPVDSPVGGLYPVGDRLLVSTESGRIMCLGGPGDTPNGPVGSTAEQIAAPAAAAAMVADILRETKVKAGYAWVLSGSSGADLALALAQRTELDITVLGKGLGKTRAARQQLARTGLYGTRIAIHSGTLGTVSYAQYFADLVVVDQPLSELPMAQIWRSVRPHGGKLWLAQPAGAVTAALVGAGIPREQFTVRSGPGQTVILRGALPGEGTWTDKYADAGRSSASAEKRVRFPLRMLWFGGTSPELMTDRHWIPAPPLYARGRMFLQGSYDVVAVDAYNGRELWSHHFPELKRMGFAYRGGSIVTDGDHVYAVLGTRCVQLDAISGKTVRSFAAPVTTEELATLADQLPYTVFPPRAAAWAKSIKKAEKRTGPEPDILTSGQVYFQDNRPVWEYLAVTDQVVVGSISVPHPVIQHAAYASPEGKLLFAFDTRTGDLLWRFRPRDSVDPEATLIQDGVIYLVDRTSVSELARRKRRHEPEALRSRLVALDAQTGKILWQRASPLPKCRRLWSSADALVLTDRPQLVVLSLPDGKELWRKHNITYSAKSGKGQISPNILGDTLYVNPHFYDLRTGKIRSMPNPLGTGEDPVKVGFRYGCGVNAFCETGAFFRAGSVGMFDLANLSGTHWLGNVRSGCWLNIIPAGGMVLMPESASGCTCPYNYQTSVAMVAGETHENWSAITAKPPARIERAAINIGAPGDQRRQDGDRRLWLGFPRAHRPNDGLRLPLLAFGRAARYVHRNADDTPVAGTEAPWIYTSGISGVRKLALDMVTDRPALCPAAAAPPTVDGRLNDACWDNRERLILRGVDQIADPDTDVFLRHDDRHLYIAYRRRAAVRDGTLVPWTARARGEHTRVFRDDSVSIRLYTKYSAVWLDVSASGASFGVRGKGYGGFTAQRLKAWARAVNTTDQLWTAEIAVPWVELATAGIDRKKGRIGVHIESINRTGVGPDRVFYRHRVEGRNGLHSLLDDPSWIAFGEAATIEPRRFTVRLHFAEIAGVPPSGRVFDVLLQGAPAIPALDVAGVVGPHRALVKEVKGVLIDDRLEIEFVPRPGGQLPVCNGLEVIPE